MVIKPIKQILKIFVISNTEINFFLMNMRTFRPILWISLFSPILFSCVKGYDPEPDPVFPVREFEGQWKGTLPYSSSGPLSEIRISLAAYSNNTNLTGYMSTPDGILIIDGQQFFSGY